MPRSPMPDPSPPALPPAPTRAEQKPAQAGRTRVTGARGAARHPVRRAAGPARSAGGPARGRGGGAKDALARRAQAPHAVYRDGDAPARAHRAQPRTRGAGAWAGRGTTAQAVKGACGVRSSCGALPPGTAEANGLEGGDALVPFYECCLSRCKRGSTCRESWSLASALNKAFMK